MLANIYFFNPTCEPAIANGSPYYTAPARLRKFESDLGYLPAWLGGKNDMVLVQGTINEEYNARMKELGFMLPTVINLDEALSDTAWINKPKCRLNPWGWSPAVHQLFKPILHSFSAEFQQSVVATWLPAHKNLYSRLTGLSLLQKIIQENRYDWLPDKANLPVVCSTLEEIYATIGSHAKSVVKSPWSSSGRGLLLFPNPDLPKKNDEVLKGMLNQQGFVTVETWMDKILDLSYQFNSMAGIVSYKGRTLFETDPKGRYVRNYLVDGANMTMEVANFLEDRNDKVVTILKDTLSNSSYSSLYEGWMGVDAMIYRSEDGRLKFQPMVEINGRFTMGSIALKLREYLASGSSGFLSIFYSKNSDFRQFTQKKELEKPLVMHDQKIVSGFLPLTPPLTQHSFGAYLEVIRYEL